MAYFQQTHAQPSKSTLIVAPAGSSVVPIFPHKFIVSSLPIPYEGDKGWFPFPLFGQFSMVNGGALQYSDIPYDAKGVFNPEQTGQILATSKEANLVLGSGVRRKIFCQSASFTLANHYDGKENLGPMATKLLHELGRQKLPVSVKALDATDKINLAYPEHVIIRVTQPGCYLGFDCHSDPKMGMSILVFQIAKTK